MPDYLTETNTIGPHAKIDKHAVVEYTKVGIATGIEAYCYVYNSDIGSFSHIAPFCYINAGQHPIQRPSLHRFTWKPTEYGINYEDDRLFIEERNSHKCHIGSDVWIGTGVTVMSDVIIHSGSVVGSGAVVTHDIGHYEIWGGVPARFIKLRFPKEIIDELLKIQWWYWSLDKIEQNMEYFRGDINNFVERFKK